MPSVVKIALVGTSCIGKTSIFNHLKNKLPSDKDIIFIDEAARDFFANNIIPENERFLYKTQKRIQDLALKREKTAHNKKPKLVICDRSALDVVAYLKAMQDHQGSDKLLSRVKSWIKTYTHLILLEPGEVPYNPDAVRTEDKESRDKFHNAYLKVFEENSISFTLINGTLEERILKVSQIIENI